MPRRSFTEEFKRSAIALVLDQKVGRIQAAKDLGLGISTLDRWVTEYQHCNSSGEVLQQMEDQKKIANLEKQLKVVTMERDILKKATAYFAKDHL